MWYSKLKIMACETILYNISMFTLIDLTENLKQVKI